MDPRIAALEAELKACRMRAATLIKLLPHCENCKSLATKAWGRGGGYCVEHAALVEANWKRRMPELPYAAAVRAIQMADALPIP